MTIKPLQLAGRIIMENGGETYRVEETVTRMGRAFGLKNVESFAVPSGVFVSCEKEDGTHETAVLRVHRRGTNLRRVDAVNQISRRAEAGEITPEEALRALEKIEHSLSFRPWQLCVAAAVSSGGFAVMFGGGVADFFVGVVTAGLVQALTCLLGRYRLEGMVSTLVGSFFTTLLPLLFYHFTGGCLRGRRADAPVAGPGHDQRRAGYHARGHCFRRCPRDERHPYRDAGGRGSADCFLALSCADGRRLRCP